MTLYNYEKFALYYLNDSGKIFDFFQKVNKALVKKDYRDDLYPLFKSLSQVSGCQCQKMCFLRNSFGSMSFP